MNVENLVRKNILKLKPYTSARGAHLSGILLDANENSMGTAVIGYDNLELNRYPDPNQNILRDLLSDYININKKSIFIGVGSDEIIDLLVRIFCEPSKDRAMILEPTYGMYKVVCDINDITTESLELDDNFDLNESHIDAIIKYNPKMVFMCSPNNPTGNALNKNRIIELCKVYNGIVLVDEAYIDFSEKDSLIGEVKNYENLIIIRTFSKAWGLAGVRCGYAIASDFIIQLLFNIKSPYNISKPTSSLIENALKNKSVKDSFVEAILKEREFLLSELKMIDKVINIYMTDANFILFKIDNADYIYKKLVEQGVIIRSRTNQVNLQNCLRVTVGNREENIIFLEKLRKVI